MTRQHIYINWKGTCHDHVTRHHNLTDFPPETSRQKATLSSLFIIIPNPQSQTLVVSVAQRERKCQGGTREPCSTATKLTLGTTAAEEPPPPTTTPSSWNSRSSSETSRPSRMSSLTERASSTIPSSFLSIWKILTPSILTSLPNSDPTLPNTFLWYFLYIATLRYLYFATTIIIINGELFWYFLAVVVVVCFCV